MIRRADEANSPFDRVHREGFDKIDLVFAPLLTNCVAWG